MPLGHLQHFLIQTIDMEQTKRWYVDVLGMDEGYTPDFKFPVAWLYVEGKDVLHLTEGGAAISENRKKYLGQTSQAERGSGVVDHLAFHATGLRDMIAHLRAKGVEFTQRQVDAQGLYQLFLFDPNGVKIELNYAATEAIGLKAEIMASDLKS